MLTPPDLAPDAMIAVLSARYGLSTRRVEFLPRGADAAAAVYRLEAADGTARLLKLRREQGAPFSGLEVALPAWLKAHGAAAALAALPAIDGALWASAHGYTWVLYPWLDGENIADLTLSDAQWRALGSALRAIHSAPLESLNPALAARLPRDDYGPRDRDRVRAWDSRVATDVFADPIAARLAGFWLANRDELRQVIARAGALAMTLQARGGRHVLCHGDFHGRNILSDGHGRLAIVDWDAATFSPPERDLMFAGASISGHWDDAREVALFYEGYGNGNGATGPNPTAEAYYRYERIVVDLAEYADELFNARGSVVDRERSYRAITGQFAPCQDAALAHRAYARLG